MFKSCTYLLVFGFSVFSLSTFIGATQCLLIQITEDTVLSGEYDNAGSWLYFVRMLLCTKMART